MPKPAHSGPDTSQLGRTQKAGLSTSPAFVLAAAVVVKHAFQQASVTSALDFEVVAEAHSASALEAVFEWRSETGRTANGAETGPGADSGVFFQVDAPPPLVGTAPGDSTMPSDCPALDMAAPQHLGTRHILPGHIHFGSTHKAEAGRRADHNQVVAVREHATLRPGT